VGFVERDPVAAVLGALQHILRGGARLLELKRRQLRGPDAELDRREFGGRTDAFADGQCGGVAGGGFRVQPAVHATQAHAEQPVGVKLKTAHGLLFLGRLQHVEATAQQRDGFGELRFFDQRAGVLETLARFPMMFLA
jgi:hypothetical protein